MIVICMPVFNEEQGIVEFVNELNENISGAHIIVVDDCLTDNMGVALDILAKNKDLSLEVIRNTTNLGHGPSTVIAMNKACQFHNAQIITIDGDGQFHGYEAAEAAIFAEAQRLDVLECIRNRETDPLFRRVVSLVTRVLVAGRCGSFVRDANTPLRIYAPGVLKQIDGFLLAKPMTPNRQISVLARKLDFTVGYFQVMFIQRRSSEVAGSTWKQ